MTDYANTTAENKLMRAIKDVDLTKVEDLLRHQYQSININDCVDIDTKLTPLMLAAWIKFNHRIVSALLQHGADPNITLSEGSTRVTALHCACSSKSYQTIELLLKYKANVNCQSRHGLTPMTPLLTSDIRSADDKEILQIVQLLLDNHANVNIQDENGMPCFFSIFRIRANAKLDVIRLLFLNANVDVNFQLMRHVGPFSGIGLFHDRKGDTILHCAVRRNDIDVVNMILQCCKPDLLICNSDNETPYDIAHRLHCKPILECLKMTLQLQCHRYLRQEWIQQMHPSTTINKKVDKTNVLSSSRIRQKK